MIWVPPSPWRNGSPPSFCLSTLCVLGRLHSLRRRGRVAHPNHMATQNSGNQYTILLLRMSSVGCPAEIWKLGPIGPVFKSRYTLWQASALTTEVRLHKDECLSTQYGNRAIEPPNTRFGDQTWLHKAYIQVWLINVDYTHGGAAKLPYFLAWAVTPPPPPTTPPQPSWRRTRELYNHQ